MHDALTTGRREKKITLRSSGCLNDKWAKRSRPGVQQKAELSAELIQRLTQGGSSGTYVLHRTRHTQEDNQLLHQAGGWRGACRRQTRRHPAGPGRLAAWFTAALDRGPGSHDFHRLDLRLLEAACPRLEGGASGDAARHRGGQEEERRSRCPHDRRPAALAVCCRNATWRRASFASAGALCAIETCW
jgi:hypothetical protein